jgi:RNA:NAD 2'-phosphotransferase (TPT1/KptA family)
MVLNQGNVALWICPSHNTKAKTKKYRKNIILYHGTKRNNVNSIMKHGLLRSHNGGDSVYIYTSPKFEIAKNYGEAIIEINGRGLDLRVWETDKENQIMVCGDVPVKNIKGYYVRQIQKQ